MWLLIVLEVTSRANRGYIVPNMMSFNLFLVAKYPFRSLVVLTFGSRRALKIF